MLFSETTLNNILSRVTTDDIKKPTEQQEASKKKREQFITDFLTTIFDNYIQDYIYFLNKQLAEFEEKLESLKREIHLEYMANKKTGG